ncbi:Rieske 2Fe-2S domain-containing protein [Vulgatibacter incomptus]|uniref:Ferredoxin, 2Fe-2S n=1 Tax=Vulgatibacter incomptus TaxID=1391653 RepID=A0A0K1PE46_9BACT|nr:Rieske 2Fe-2S domain-containing protein [Vulgatibacter incomptus]AKU91767.1 Ferredoxin, 2Fe-2S [Vulgatibacter incomptus]
MRVVHHDGIETRRPVASLLAALGRSELRTITQSKTVDQVGRPVQMQLKRWSRPPAAQRIKDFLNGTWLGHPLHPAITDVPIGAWTTAVALDLATLAGRKDLGRAARAALLVGIVGAVGSALTGLADWADTRDEQRRVGVVHALLNTIGLGLQIGSVVKRSSRNGGGRALTAAGLATTAAAAWLGGNLVFSQGTQVQRTAWTRGPRTFTHAMDDSELAADKPTRAVVDGLPVMLVRHEDEIFALQDTCGHAGCPLSGGQVKEGAIVCPCHGSTYRLRDGAVLHGPAPFAQPGLDVRVEEGRIEVRSRRT